MKLGGKKIISRTHSGLYKTWGFDQNALRRFESVERLDPACVLKHLSDCCGENKEGSKGGMKVIEGAQETVKKRLLSHSFFSG